MTLGGISRSVDDILRPTMISATVVDDRPPLVLEDESEVVEGAIASRRLQRKTEVSPRHTVREELEALDLR